MMEILHAAQRALACYLVNARAKGLVRYWSYTCRERGPIRAFFVRRKPAVISNGASAVHLGAHIFLLLGGSDLVLEIGYQSIDDSCRWPPAAIGTQDQFELQRLPCPPKEQSLCFCMSLHFALADKFVDFGRQDQATPLVASVEVCNDIGGLGW